MIAKTLPTRRLGTQRYNRSLAAGGPAREDNGEGGGYKKFPSLLMGVVTTDNAQRTDFERLADGVSPHVGRTAVDTSSPALLALLLTPSYAEHALAHSTPIRILEALGITGDQVLHKPLDVITAVVDSLPSGNGRTAGEEGIAYLFKRNAAPMSDASRKPFNPKAQKPGSLTFEVHPLWDPTYHFGAQLPLAQTVFSNGKASTLVQMRYESDARGRLAVVAEEHLEAQTIELPFQEVYSSTSFKIPLLPLTPMREVTHSMGNIVRTVSSPPSQGPSQSQPASQELEAAVASYFQARGMTPETVRVWALIEPKATQWPSGKHETLRTLNTETISKYWKPQYVAGRVKLAHNFKHHLRRGSRLCRVISGGGGWGKKAGLLSLDPDSVYSSRELRADVGWDFDLDDDSAGALERQQTQALGDVVKQGECIMFFIAPRDDGFRSMRSMSRAWNNVDHARIAVMFGTVPSTVDTLPTPTPDQRSQPVKREEVQPKLCHRPNFFGALSETGLALSVKMHEEVRHLRLSKGEHGQSKLDVPFSHIRITESPLREGRSAPSERQVPDAEARESVQDRMHDSATPVAAGGV
ncbi:hypothetical protein LTR53_014777 [Teratosphaeriaceae sp. CCFEE 6253]|nr:hypothetical protein LTR53_014777 [Teratosphaeriaceae sp. CCFEE 6253]